MKTKLDPTATSEPPIPVEPQAAAEAEEDESVPADELDALDGPAPFAALAALTEEAKTAFLPTEPEAAEWAAMEERLVLRLATERALARRSRRTQLVVGVVSSLALAAGAIFLIRPAEPLSPSEPTPTLASVVKGGPRGAALSNAPASGGDSLFQGDPVEVTGGPLAFEVPGAGAALVTPRRAIWALDPAGEGSAKAVLTKATSATLVVALERGALEADVTPERDGEAFAVDVAGAAGTTRVAVHGTHLRVARKGDHVTIDLSEGVVVVGAPGTGLTTGLELRAPAHLELEAGAAPSAAQVTRDARPAWALDLVAAGQPPAGSASAAAPVDPVPDPDPESTATKPNPARPVAPPPAPVALTEARALAAIQVDLKRCVAQAAVPGAVRVSIDSELSVEVRADGTVAGTRFTPPLAPAIQECASGAIFARRIEGPRTLVIPVKFEF